MTEPNQTVIPDAAPVTAEPAVAPIQESAPVIQESAPITESAPAPTVIETLLGPEPTKPDAVETPAEPTAPVETKQADATVEPVALPTYEKFTLPEGSVADEARLSQLSQLLGELENSKGDHAIHQANGQKLVDMHVAGIKAANDTLIKGFQDHWEKQRTAWADDFKNDPDIGGKRQETTLSKAREFIATHGGDAESQKVIYDVLNSSGLCNHKAMIGLFAKAMTGMREGQPLTAQVPPAAPQSKIQRMYGKKSA